MKLPPAAIDSILANIKEQLTSDNPPEDINIKVADLVGEECPECEYCDGEGCAVCCDKSDKLPGKDVLDKFAPQEESDEGDEHPLSAMRRAGLKKKVLNG